MVCIAPVSCFSCEGFSSCSVLGEEYSKLLDASASTPRRKISATTKIMAFLYLNLIRSPPRHRPAAARSNMSFLPGKAIFIADIVSSCYNFNKKQF
jgi:hypothetical protein